MIHLPTAMSAAKFVAYQHRSSVRCIRNLALSRCKCSTRVVTLLLPLSNRSSLAHGLRSTSIRIDSHAQRVKSTRPGPRAGDRVRIAPDYFTSQRAVIPVSPTSSSSLLPPR